MRGPAGIPHITVCVCTFKRPELLQRLLDGLAGQTTEGAFRYSVVIADNDKAESARPVVWRVQALQGVPIVYCVEPEQNIALARNRALANAGGDFVAMIDDDEFPQPDWLLHLLRTCLAYGSSGVLGPVRPSFQTQPPAWVIKAGIFDRPTHDTGHMLDWHETRAGNALFRREILDGPSSPFRAEFGTGSEDVDFFRRMMERGRSFVWCNEAVVFESVPAERCTRSYLVRLALLRGRNSLKHPRGRPHSILTSVVAVPVYSLALPFLALAGQHRFMDGLIRLCDHAGRLLGVLGLEPVKERPGAGCSVAAEKPLS